jgi:hypothetical protein
VYQVGGIEQVDLADKLQQVSLSAQRESVARFARARPYRFVGLEVELLACQDAKFFACSGISA